MASPIHGAAGMPTRKRRCPRCGHVQTVALVVAKREGAVSALRRPDPTRDGRQQEQHRQQARRGG